MAASSRNYRFSANVQVVIDADRRLVIASAPPAPGNQADAHIWRESDLLAAAAGTTVIANGAYPGNGLIVRIAEESADSSCAVRSTTPGRRVRARSSTPSARMRNWKILRDCHQKGDGVHQAVQAVATMHNLVLTGRNQQANRHTNLPIPTLLQQPVPCH